MLNLKRNFFGKNSFFCTCALQSPGEELLVQPQNRVKRAWMQRRRAQGEQQESNPPRSRELDLVILLGHFQLEVFHDFMAAVFANDSENLYFIYLSYMTWQIMVIVDLVIALLNKKILKKHKGQQVTLISSSHQFKHLRDTVWRIQK